MALPQRSTLHVGRSRLPMPLLLLVLWCLLLTRASPPPSVLAATVSYVTPDTTGAAVHVSTAIHRSLFEGLRDALPQDPSSASSSASPSASSSSALSLAQRPPPLVLDVWLLKKIIVSRLALIRRDPSTPSFRQVIRLYMALPASAHSSILSEAILFIDRTIAHALASQTVNRTVLLQIYKEMRSELLLAFDADTFMKRIAEGMQALATYDIPSFVQHFRRREEKITQEECAFWLGFALDDMPAHALALHPRAMLAYALQGRDSRIGHVDAIQYWLKARADPARFQRYLKKASLRPDGRDGVLPMGDLNLTDLAHLHDILIVGLLAYRAQLLGKPLDPTAGRGDTFGPQYRARDAIQTAYHAWWRHHDHHQTDARSTDDGRRMARSLSRRRSKGAAAVAPPPSFIEWEGRQLIRTGKLDLFRDLLDVVRHPPRLRETFVSLFGLPSAMASSSSEGQQFLVRLFHSWRQAAEAYRRSAPKHWTDLNEIIETLWVSIAAHTTLSTDQVMLMLGQQRLWQGTLAQDGRQSRFEPATKASTEALLWETFNLFLLQKHSTVSFGPMTEYTLLEDGASLAQSWCKGTGMRSLFPLRLSIEARLLQEADLLADHPLSTAAAVAAGRKDERLRSQQSLWQSILYDGLPRQVASSPLMRENDMTRLHHFVINRHVTQGVTVHPRLFTLFRSAAHRDPPDGHVTVETREYQELEHAPPRALEALFAYAYVQHRVASADQHVGSAPLRRYWDTWRRLLAVRYFFALLPSASCDVRGAARAVAGPVANAIDVAMDDENRPLPVIQPREQAKVEQNTPTERHAHDRHPMAIHRLLN